MRTTQAIISKSNLIDNLKTIKSLVAKETQMCVPVKANAYGHGAVQIAKAALESGCSVTHLAVAACSEAAELRENGITSPIIMFSMMGVDEVEDVLRYDIEPFIFDEETVDIFEQKAEIAGKVISVHLAIDTGMGRVGCRPEAALHMAEYISDKKHVRLAGICTHFAVSDSVKNEDKLYTKIQLERFSSAVESIKKAGINPGLVHCANSGAILMYPEAQFDMVRPGIIVYGYFPDKGVKELSEKTFKKVINLKPVMKFQTKICAIKTIHKGESISYGRTWTSTEETDIATLPVGYADGLLRRYATQNKSLYVFIKGKPYPVVGRICMDQCMVNLGRNHNVERWDEAVIFGSKEEGYTTAEEIADSCGTISYEVLCALTNRVPRLER